MVNRTAIKQAIVVDQETLGSGQVPEYVAFFNVEGKSLYGSVDGLQYRGAWAASTSYAANDLVTYRGHQLVASTEFISGSVFSPTNWTVLAPEPGVFYVSLYGAQGDGTTDDTAAINSAISAATTYALAGSYYAEVVFDSAVYLCSSATTKNSTYKGNSQIPLPLIPTTGQKVTLVLRGVRDATAVPHWEQTTVQAGGAVIKSTLIGQTVDGTYGPPSVIGGPTAAQGYGVSDGLFNNMLIVVDGLTILVPADPTLLGMNFSGMAQANISNAAVNASTTPGSGLPTLATHSWAYGLYMPQTRNNDNANIGNYSCEGMFCGMVLSEHAVVLSCRIIYCAIGIMALGNSSDTIYIAYASVEACVVTFECDNISGGTGCHVLAFLDVEGNAGSPFVESATVKDTDNYLLGEIRVRRLSGTPTQGADPLVTGATGVKILNTSRRTGHIASPSVPVSTVAAAVIYRDAAVTIAGGTVTAITVDGTATGITSGTVIVPSGRTIAITYSVAPTWVWNLL